MIKLGELLRENAWDTSAKTVSKLIFDFVKETYEEHVPKEVDVVEDEYMDNTVSFPIELYVYRDTKLFKGDVFVDGGVKPPKAPKKMEIDVYLNPKKEPGIYSRLYAELYDVVRHELQHLSQGGPNARPGRAPVTFGKARTKADKAGRFAYTMLPDETEALVYGFLLRAKLEKVPITTIFKNQLDGWLQDKEITKDEYKKIFDVWVDFTKKHIPTAKLK